MLQKIYIYLIILIIGIGILVFLYIRSLSHDKLLTRDKLLKLFKRIKLLKCNNTNKCIAFGDDKQTLNTFFEFSTFNYLENPQKRIGVASGNGFVTLFNYKRDGLESSAVLKSSLAVYADNLFYEYIVGKVYINEQLKYFPCFVETYSVYINNDILTNDGIETNKSDEIRDKFKKISDTILQNNTNIKETCSNNAKLSLLIDTVPEAIPFYDLLEDQAINKAPDFLYTVINILFQIYSVLSVLQSEFTHYDLHGANVLLYKVENNGYITMNYTKDGKIISFNTKYIAKIIDYGKSFYKISNPQNVDSSLNSSTSFYKNIISNIAECTSVSGLYAGYYNKTKDELLADSSYASIILNNKSHDLRLLFLVKLLINHYKILGPISEWIKKFEVKFLDTYGTPIAESDGNPTNINNVTDAYKYMRKELETITRPEYKDKKGTMNISLDRTIPLTLELN